MSFKIRTTKPEAGNKYYIRKASGGWSNAVKGKPTDPDCDVLANCVGYAYGRFNEIGGWESCKYLSPVNAERFIDYATGLTVSQSPQIGACMVWQKGATKDGSDGAGHVAIVEKVLGSGEVYTSESGYNSKAFWNQNRKKGSDGNWGQSSSYKFLGFLLNPAPCCKTGNNMDAEEIEPAKPEKTEVKMANVSLPVIKRGVKIDAVKAMQTLLNLRDKAGLDVDGSCGPASDAAIRAFQRKHGLAVDGSCGPATWAKLIGG